MKIRRLIALLMTAVMLLSVINIGAFAEGEVTPTESAPEEVTSMPPAEPVVEAPTETEQTTETPAETEQTTETPAEQEQQTETPTEQEQQTESPAVTEEPTESPAETEEQTENPEVSPSPIPESAPVFAADGPASLALSPSGSYVTGGETLTLTVNVVGTVNNIEASVDNEALGTVAYNDADKTVVFTPNADGTVGTATVTVKGKDAEEADVTASASVNVAYKYNVAFSQINNTAGIYTGPATVYGGQTYTFTFREKGEDFNCYTYSWKTYTVEDPAVSGPDSEGNFTVSIPQTFTPNGGAAPDTFIIELTGSAAKEYTVTPDTSPESSACDTLYFDSWTARYKQEKPFTLLIKHPQDKREEPEDNNFVYSMPMLKRYDSVNGSWEDYFGFKLETLTDDVDYTKTWMLSIPGEDITGDFMIFASKDEKYTDDPETKETDETTVVRNISFFGSSDGTTEENIPGLSVFSNEALDASEERAENKDYYFSLDKGPSMRTVEYSVDSGEPVPVEKVGDYLYKIPWDAITGDIEVRIKDPNVFSVTKQGSGKGEEVLIELSSDIAPKGNDYTFKVKHHEMALISDLNIIVTIGGTDYVLGDGTNGMTYLKSGDYLNVTIPADMIINDILITAKCNSEVKCAVIFEDAYYAAEKYFNYRFTAFKIVLVKEKEGVVTRELLDKYIKPETRSIRVELAPYETLRFEVVCPKPNSVGKYYTDPNTNCYLYNFTGSTMGGKTIGDYGYIQDTPVYLFPTDQPIIEPGNTYHVDYNLGAVTGDTVIKVKPLMAKFGVRVAGTGAEYITLSKSYASYRSNFTFTKNVMVKLESISAGGKMLELNAGYRYEAGSDSTIIIDGGYIKGDIVINAFVLIPEEPVQHKSTAVTSVGTEYGIDVNTFRPLDNGHYVYLITAEGDPVDERHPSFDGHEMIYYEPYGAYVWLTVSDEEPEVFDRNVDDLFDELSDDELERLRNERINSGKSTEEEENAIKDAINDLKLAGDLNGDGVVDSKDVSIARELYMNRNAEDREKSMGLYLLADVNCSRTIDMKDVAMIKRLAGSDKTAEKERSFLLDLSADGEHRVTVNQDDEITVELKLVRTDKNEEEDAAVSVIQDEIHFDGKFLRLLGGTKLADGVEMTVSKAVSDNRKDSAQCISISYVASDTSAKLERETVLATFRFKVIDNDLTAVVSHNNAFVTADDGETVYSCHLTDLTIASERILPSMCAVTFNYMGAAEDETVEVIEGSSITAPLIIPEYDGYIFDGWYADEECTEAWDFEQGVVESDMTLYAKWNEVEGFNPIWIGIIALALLAAGGAAILIYRRRYY